MHLAQYVTISSRLLTASGAGGAGVSLIVDSFLWLGETPLAGNTCRKFDATIVELALVFFKYEVGLLVSQSLQIDF